MPAFDRLSAAVKSAPIQAKTLFFLFLYCTVAHYQLLFSDFVLWDDWVFIGPVSEGDWKSLYNQTFTRSCPLEWFMYYFASFFPSAAWATHFWTYLSILMISGSLFMILDRSKVLPTWISAFIAAWAVSWPGYGLWILGCMLHFTACIAFSLFGLYVYQSLFLQKQRRSPKWTKRQKQLRWGVASVFIFMGFFFKPVLIFYYLIFGLIVFSKRDEKGARFDFSPKNIVSKVRSEWFFFILPPAQLLISGWFFKATAHHAGIYELNTNYSDWPILFEQQIGRFLYQGVLDRLQDAFTFVGLGKLAKYKFLLPLLLGPGLVALGYKFFQKKKYYKSKTLRIFADNLLVISVLIVFYFMLIAPYMTLNKSPLYVFVYNFRFSLISAIVCACLLGFLVHNLSLILTRWPLALLSLLMTIGFTLYQYEVYMGLQYRWILSRGASVELSKKPELAKHTTIILSFEPENRPPLKRWVFTTPFAIQEISAIARMAWDPKGQKWAGLSAGGDIRCMKESMYGEIHPDKILQSGEYRREGIPLRLVISDSQAARKLSPSKIVNQYLWKTFTAGESEIRDWLAEITEIRHWELPPCSQ